MFGFFKRKSAPAPEQIASNPGIGTEAMTTFTNGSRTWTEKFNLIDLAARAFRNRGYPICNEKTWLHHTASGYQILPLFVSMEPTDNGSVHTTTTIQVNHPTLAPRGVFEYQHSFGDNIADSIAKGFDQWLQTDFVTLLEASRDEHGTCMTLEMEFPEQDGRPAGIRRAILGPVAHYAQNPPKIEEEHPFCPCCMLTRSFEAFKQYLEGNDFVGIRFYAARDENGDPQADCRVNGDDWEDGAEALRFYVSSWPDAGFEFRKQYVVLRSAAMRINI